MFSVFYDALLYSIAERLLFRKDARPETIPVPNSASRKLLLVQHSPGYTANNAAESANRSTRESANVRCAPGCNWSSQEGAGCDFPAPGRAAERHFVTVNLPSVVWPGRAREFRKVRSLLCIFRLTTSRAYDSLLWWWCCGHIVAGGRRCAPRPKGKRKGPGYAGIQGTTKNEKQWERS